MQEKKKRTRKREKERSIYKEKLEAKEIDAVFDKHFNSST